MGYRSMNGIQGVLFDADGTLIDTHDVILSSMRHTINDILGKDATDVELMAGVGTPLYDQMLHFAEGDAALATCLVQTYREHNDLVHDAGIRSFPETLPALERLRAAGIPLGVVTSKRHAMAARGLRICGIEDFFEVLVGSDDFSEHKPSPGPILHACRLMDLDPLRCVYVGDSPFDIQAGNAAGCKSIAALWGMFSPAALHSENPTAACDSPFQVADWVLERLRVEKALPVPFTEQSPPK